MTSYIKKLPAVFQTVTEKKFFNATVDQVFSKKDSDLLYGYIGRRTPSQYDPVSDFYLPEPTKNRTWWQLEATAYARNADATQANIFFYDDLLNRIDYYGGNTLNQSRLFESEYYSWAPPIDFDMFTNYQNYYWVEQGLEPIEIANVMYGEIVSTSSYTTPTGLTLSTGMTILLSSDAAPGPYVVENVGYKEYGTGGIRLVAKTPDYTPGTILEFMPWDGTIELANGRIIRNTTWDTLTWDVQAQPGNADYITIERGAIDRNAWSRTNKWVHIDTINASIAVTGTGFPVSASRALRPIIQFAVDLPLYKSGSQFNSDISYGFGNSSTGESVLLSHITGRTQTYVFDTYGIQINTGNLVIFMEDAATRTNIYRASVVNDDITLTYVSQVHTGDIIFATASTMGTGAQRGQNWYYTGTAWTEAFNDKVSTNQPPLFQLTDHSGVPLDDAGKYPGSTFAGSKIFSYKINSIPGAATDPVLQFPIVYTSLGQASDIIFQNNLLTDQYTYGATRLPITGYYYYTFANDPTFYNNWNLHSVDTALLTPSKQLQPSSKRASALSKQRVIDKFVVGYGTQYQFKLSTTPTEDADSLIVAVNGIEVKSIFMQANGYSTSVINGSIFVDLELYITELLLNTQGQPPVVELQTYTHGLLSANTNGYYQIPQQLEANPSQLEIIEISASNLIEQFTSIIQAQLGATGASFGSSNTYRDSLKNRSVGSFILQNVSPALKSMLVSSSNDLDVISAIRFSQDEYTKFKNKYLRIASQLINQEFSPLQYHNGTVVISKWVDEILKTVNISKEFSSSFAYSYMIANGAPFAIESFTVDSSCVIELNNYIDLTDARNAIYVYDITNTEKLLVIDVDYRITSTNLPVTVSLDSRFAGKQVHVSLYKNPIPAYIPSTPTKVGTYGSYVPRMELDTSYAVPANVIIGHDGSKTIAYGDYRDQLLLELECRIYNLLQDKFRKEYYQPLRIEAVKPGYFRNTRYSRDEYLGVTESYLNKWAAKNRANYRINDWLSASVDTPAGRLWKLYNYSLAVNTAGEHLNLPGNWKGVFQHFYDTYHPDTRPWEMLGFTQQPAWWVLEYTTNWASTNTKLWEDLEAGIIRQGPSAIYNPVTLQPQPQAMWARPGLSTVIPVDSAGIIVPLPALLNIAMSGDLYAPFDGFDNPWVYGDGGPVEQVWMSTSGYAFSTQEFLYLMKPGPFGELLWDTVGTQHNAGIDVPGVSGSVMSDTNWQYVQNDKLLTADTAAAWTRPTNRSQYVHAESVDSVIQVRYGYQRWISDRILFLGKDITDTFGQKIRTLDVSLANKLAGFTNKDTSSMYIESVSSGTSTTSLLIPTNNFSVSLHKGQPIKTYSYSGVIVRALDNGMFAVYGYDLLNAEFTVLERSSVESMDITTGGTPAEFRIYAVGDTYQAGEIVRYNGVYYSSNAVQTAGKFTADTWQKLRALPITGGVSVSYMPVSGPATIKVPYGSVLGSVQEVFDLLIGWGAYLETQGWQFNDVNTDTTQVSDWLGSAKQFLFWLNTGWAPDASIQLSPLANSATLIVEAGYPDDVESISNGAYSILNKSGIAIPPNSTSTDRDGKSITVSVSSLADGGIYFLQINASETEHVLMFDNTTSFNDVVYDPLLRARQQRLRFNGFRSNGWYGKMEAPGYLIINSQLVPNYDTIVESMRYFYDPDVTIDNPGIESLGRHLIGYESKDYLDNMQVSNDVQYLFYQGAIRQKGTVQAFDKLFRSTKIQSNETIEVYEEWALKLGDFGNTVEQVSTEFILSPELNSGEVIVARLNFKPSTIGGVKQISILNAETIYSTVPKITVGLPDLALGDPALAGREPVPAKAYAVLDSVGRISRVDLSNIGYGYTSAPEVRIEAVVDINIADQLYAIWQGEIIKDAELNNVIDIDIDDTATWVIRPVDPANSLEFPTTGVTEYALPNAGYVNFNDVDWNTFSASHAIASWGKPTLNPAKNDTVWVAKTFTEDWGVYKLVATDVVWSVIANAADNLVLTTDVGMLIPQWESTSALSTDLGNMICLQIAPTAGNKITDNYVTQFAYSYTDGTTHYYDLLDVDGNPLSRASIGVFAELTDMLLFKTMRFETIPAPIYYAEYNDKVWVDDVNGQWNVRTYGITKFTAQFASLTPYRAQEQLIDSTLFESAQIYQEGTGNKLARLPVYDPFKGIIPAPAKQNISYMLLQDPAKYNVTGNIRLFNENIIFADAQIGKLWWDLSTVRYAYYEQPVASDETHSQNLEYRRDRWGQMMPGSTIDIYEWTKSPVPPAEYAGTGTVRSTTDYVQVAVSDRFTSLTTTNYYFWVLNSTTKPNVANRTLTAIDVSRMLSSPKSQGFAFFAPVQQTPNSNAYMFYNVQELLSLQGNHVQINYRLADRNDQPHAQWKFFREGDSASVVTSQYWDKLTDSLCGYTRILPISSEWSNGVVVGKYLWDIYGWDIAEYDGTSSVSDYGVVLPVPDPSLSNSEKYGIGYRPRQGMFSNLLNARKVFVQAANALLKHIPIRDNNQSWNADVKTSTYWVYTDWAEVGYENVVPTAVYSTLLAAQAALVAGQLPNGTIVEITNGTTDGRFVLYEVIQVNANVSVQSFKKVGVESSAISLLDTIYTVQNKFELAAELRDLLNAFRSNVFINQYVVDQNSLYFSMLNYVVSEQRAPDWLFKSSYIYIKENNIPLAQEKLYVPAQIDNIISYITDSKPYHTQIRDYTSSYTTTDIADGTASDFVETTLTLTFNPANGGPYESGDWDIDCRDPSKEHYWDSMSWDVCPDESNRVDAEYLNQQISQLIGTESIYSIPLTVADPSKIGLSALFPYTFDFNSINTGTQTFTTPASVVSVLMGDVVLHHSRDYYAEYNSVAQTYTVYFFTEPAPGVTPIATVVWDGGPLTIFTYSPTRTEVAYGFPTESFVITVKTKLPVYKFNNIYYPYLPITSVDARIAEIITTANNGNTTAYDATAAASGQLVYLPTELAYQESVTEAGNVFYKGGTVVPYLAASDSNIWNKNTDASNWDDVSPGGIWYSHTGQAQYLKL